MAVSSLRKSEAAAHFFKEGRVRAGLTQREVADQLGYSTPQYVSNWERGMCLPPMNALSKLVKLYGLDREEVVGVLVDAQEEEIWKAIKTKPRMRKAR